MHFPRVAGGAVPLDEPDLLVQEGEETVLPNQPLPRDQASVLSAHVPYFSIEILRLLSFLRYISALKSDLFQYA